MSGQLGINRGFNPNENHPLAVRSTTGLAGTQLRHVTRVSAGGYHTCAITVIPKLEAYPVAECWGQNSDGQLGIGSIANKAYPFVVEATNGLGQLVGVKGISAGGYQTCARVLYVAYCWGDNSSGQLGDGTVIKETLPVRIKDPSVPSGFLPRLHAIDAGGQVLGNEHLRANRRRHEHTAIDAGRRGVASQGARALLQAHNPMVPGLALQHPPPRRE